MQKTRTFIAVDIAEAVRERAAQLIEMLHGGGGEVKWVEADKMHLTLKFLGDVAAADVSSVCQAVAQAVSGLPPFSMSLHGAGAFPHLGRPRTIWIGVAEGAEALGAIHRVLDKALKPLGFPKEQRAFHPHLTLGRIRRGGPELRELSDRLREQEAYNAGSTRVDEVVVYASYLDRSGSTYQAMSRAPLSG